MKTEPTELNKKEPVLAVNHMVDWTDEGKSITTDICYKWLKIAFKEGQYNPKIKKLEWEERKFCYIARTAFGFYRILDASTFRKKQSCVLYFGETVQRVSVGTYKECIKNAQVDFEKRIKECLIIE